MTKTQSLLIQSAGRILSQSNADRLKSAFLEIGRTLLAAGAISANELGTLFEDIAEKLENSPSGDRTLEAGSLKECFQRNAWRTNIQEAMRLLEYHLHDLGFLSDKELRDQGVSDKKAFIKQLIADLEEILLEASDLIPAMPETHVHLSPVPVGLYAESSESKEDPITEAIEATAQPVNIDIELVFERPIELLAAETKGRGRKSAQSANKRPIKGVLFRIDEASETAPSKGSEYPLYIPLEVAEAAKVAINAAKGLPLDADPSLKKHANQEIVGIMVSAEIAGNDFIVNGHLFPWNQEEKVSAIESKREILGMSLNAHASGRIKEMQGREVFYLDHLDILGANILFKDRATYQKTRLIPTEIAASAIEPTQPTINTMELEQQIRELQKTLIELNASAVKTAETTEAKMQELLGVVQGQQNLINQIQAERQQHQSAIQAQATEAEKLAERNSFLQAMTAAFEEKLVAQKEEFINAINPSRSPQRITRPLVSVAAEGQQQQVGSALEKRLIEAQGKLSAYEENGITGTNRIALTEEIHTLKSQLGLLG